MGDNPFANQLAANNYGDNDTTQAVAALLIKSSEEYSAALSGYHAAVRKIALMVYYLVRRAREDERFCRALEVACRSLLVDTPARCPLSLLVMLAIVNPKEEQDRKKASRMARAVDTLLDIATDHEAAADILRARGIAELARMAAKNAPRRKAHDAECGSLPASIRQETVSGPDTSVDTDDQSDDASRGSSPPDNSGTIDGDDEVEESPSEDQSGDIEGGDAVDDALPGNAGGGGADGRDTNSGTGRDVPVLLRLPQGLDPALLTNGNNVGVELRGSDEQLLGSIDIFDVIAVWCVLPRR